MRSNLRFWLAVSFLLAAGAIVIWFKGQTDRTAPVAAWAQPPSATKTAIPPLMSMPSVLATQKNPSAKKGESPAALRARYQISNVPDSIENLTRRDSAILMKNALIDTRQPVELSIPPNLRAGKNPGAYIVQADSATTAGFQKMLKDAGADIVAYVPNNAFLVRAGSDAADNLKGMQGVQAVLPYEPYYKLDTRLMKFAVDGETLADDAWLRVTLFPGTSAAALASIGNVAGHKEHSPFGDQVLVQAPVEKLAELAQLGEVQIIEPFNPRIPANDLTRVRLGVSTDTLTNGNHLNLNGSNVWVNLNDFGVDSNHPALAGRVFYQNGNGSKDTNGHGTHIAATIMGGSNTRIFDNLKAVPEGSMRTNIVVSQDDNGNTTTNFFIDGSLTNADFRGLAHKAKLFVLPIDFNPDVNDFVTDSYLIETAAKTNYNLLGRTNTLISNNSWNYAQSPEYDSQAARFDAATRDALPEQTGSQPVVYVFAAGNQGFGDEDGSSGEPGRIASPGTAKNVITIGALEAPRFIAEALTNVEEQVEFDPESGKNITNKFTNLVQLFQPTTDSQDQVASFSSRGNVGIGVEGAFGRFKPDLVAPGTFIMSARSTNWNLANDYNPADLDFKPIYDVLSNLNAVATQYRYDSGTSFSAGGVSGMLALIQQFFSENTDPLKRRDLSPALFKAMLINAARSVNVRYDLEVQNRINYQGWGLADLRNLLTTNLQGLAEKDWPIKLIEQSPTNAIATGEERVWHFIVDTNTLAQPLRFTLVWTDPPGNPQVGVKLVNDLDLVVEADNGSGTTTFFHGNDFVSGATSTESRIQHDEAFADRINNVENVIIGDPQGLGTNYTVRVIGKRVNVKAVNDYYNATGRTNEIVQDFALVISADNLDLTNVFQKFDRADSQEFNARLNTNVFVQPIFNAVEATNQRVGANSPLYWTNGNKVQWNFYVFTNNDKALTDGLPVPGLKAGRNVAFITSGPLNIGAPRNLEPDLDLYVSKDPLLTNLNPAAVNAAWKSTTRLGTEQVVFVPDEFVRDANGNPTTNRVDLYDPAHPELGGAITNVANIDDIFYVAVKSEDQQAGEYTLIAISTDQPLEEDRNGIRVIHLLVAPQAIPDGTPNLPQGRRYYGVPLRGGRILDASLYVAQTHDEMGDLISVLGHGTRYADLYNHSLPNGFTNALQFVYSDYAYASTVVDPIEYPPFAYKPPLQLPTLTRSDGPRFLTTFQGAQASAVWTFDVADTAAGHTGVVNQAEVHVKPLNPPLLNGELVSGTVGASNQVFYPIDVPNNATKVTLTLTIETYNPQVFLLVKKDFVPSTNDFDYIGTFTNGATNVTISFDLNSKPPLIPGEYIVGIINNSSVAANYTLRMTIEFDNTGAFRSVIGDSFVFLDDDAKTVSEQDYFLDKIVTGASVAIVSENARVSDLTLRLTSPQGTSVLLSENRGWFTDGFGSEDITTNRFGDLFFGPSYAVFTDDLGTAIKFAPLPFNDSNTNRGFAFGNSFEGAPEGNYIQNAKIDGWNVDSNAVAVVTGDAEDGVNYLNLVNGAISRKLPTIPGRPYKLTFAYRGLQQYSHVFIQGSTDWITQPSLGSVFSTGQTEGDDAIGSHTNAPNGSFDPHYRIVNNPDPNFPPPPGQTGSTLWIAITNQPPFPVWFANDTNSQWLALMPQNDNNHPAGIYTNRTSFVVNGDAALVRVNGRVAADDNVVIALINGIASPISVGNTTAFSTPFTLSGFQPGVNTIDFIVQNTGSGSEGFRAQLSEALIVNPAPTDSAQLVTNDFAIGYMKLAGLQTNLFSVTGEPGWQTFETEFIADSTNMVLQFYAITNAPGIDIDDVVLTDTGTVFLHPEESLSLITGERAMGEWKLEAIDNRTGANNPSLIVDWQLLLDTANAPRLAEALAPGVRYPSIINNPRIRADITNYTPGRIIRGETEWFYYDVCDDATAISISMFTTASNQVALELLADRSGFPTGDNTRDDYVILRSTPGVISTVTMPFTLTSPAAAPLRPGKRLFFAVRGAVFFGTNDFILRVAPNNCAFTPPTLLGLNTSIASVAFAATPGDDGEGFQTTTTGASSVKVSLQDTGNLTVLAANGFDPTPTNYQLSQTVTSGDATLSLPSAGTWFLRVVNNGDNSVPYTLTSTSVSGLSIKAVAILNGHLNVTWQSVAGSSYEIATSTDLVNWSTSTTLQANSTQTTYTDPAAAGGTARFIRIRPL